MTIWDNLNNPIQLDDGKWYYWDEGKVWREGPFETRRQAVAGHEKYKKRLAKKWQRRVKK